MNAAVFEAVKKSLDYIEANLSRAIGVRDVADSVSYSQFYFSREFARCTHQTVYDYIMKRKVSESYKRLFQEKIRIVDLAFLYGFQSHEVYTRAFKKFFGELPSEASVYRPLAVFEAIDEPYLSFLCTLRAEKPATPHPDLFFEIAGPNAVADASASRLVQLSAANPYQIEQVFHGTPVSAESGSLAFRLRGLQALLRVHSDDLSGSLRYFSDQYFNAPAIRAHYILLRHENHRVDILAPARP